MSTDIYHRISSKELAKWADEPNIRYELPRLIRHLCLESVCEHLLRCSFHSNEENGRPGEDGVTECTCVHPFVPQGKSYWEIGTNKQVKTKADADYKKFLNKDIPDRNTSTYVFVTPRNWRSKEKWIQDKKQDGKVKDIRVIDGHDISNWLEQCPCTGALAHHLIGKPMDGIRALDETWNEWSKQCTPPLPDFIFSDDIVRHKAALLGWLGTNDGQAGHLTIRADSSLEGLAFLHAFNLDSDLKQWTPRFLVVDDPNIVPILIKNDNVILVAASREVGRRFYSLNLKSRFIHIKSANEPDVREDELSIRLSLISSSNLNRLLSSYPDKVKDIANDSCGSRTIIRRLLSINPDVREPSWINDKKHDISTLIPLLFAGGIWCKSNHDSTNFISKFIDEKDIESYERALLSFASEGESPIWAEDDGSDGVYIGLGAPMDTLRLLASRHYIEEQHVKKFHDLFANVIHEWNRNHNRGFIMEALFNTLLLFSLRKHEWLPYIQESIDKCTDHIWNCIITSEDFLSTFGRNLHLIAEIWPKEYVNFIDDVIGRLEMEEFKHIMSIWAISNSLENSLSLLAVNPHYFEKACSILIKIFKVTQNHITFNIIRAIFSSFFPQTNASIEKRLMVLRGWFDNNKDIAWKICIGEVCGGYIGQYNYSAIRRQDAWQLLEYDRSNEKHFVYRNKLIQLCLNQDAYNIDQILEVIDLFNMIPEHLSESYWRMLKNHCSVLNVNDRKKCLITFKEIVEPYRLDNKNANISLFVKQALNFIDTVLLPDQEVRDAELFSFLKKREVISSKAENPDEKLLEERIKIIRSFEDKSPQSLRKLISIPFADYRGFGRAIAYALPIKQLEDHIIYYLNDSEIGGNIICGVLSTYQGCEYIKLHHKIKISAKDKYIDFLLLDAWREEKRELLGEISDAEQLAFWKKVQVVPVFQYCDSTQYCVEHLYNAERYVDILTMLSYIINDKKLSKTCGVIIARVLYALADTSKDCRGIDSTDIFHNIISSLEYIERISNAYNTTKLEFGLFPYIKYHNYSFPRLKRYLIKHPRLIWGMSSHALYEKMGYNYLNAGEEIIYSAPNILTQLPESVSPENWLRGLKYYADMHDISPNDVILRLIGGIWENLNNKDELYKIMESLEPHEKNAGSFIHGIWFDSYHYRFTNRRMDGSLQKKIANELIKCSRGIRQKYPHASSILKVAARYLEVDSQREETEARVSTRIAFLPYVRLPRYEN